MPRDKQQWFKKKLELKRKKAIKEYYDSILIVCEGERTEPNYFKSFQTPSIQVEVIGKGSSNIRLVEDAIAEWKKCAKEDKYFEKIWCVFDRDDFPSDQYNQAFVTIGTEEARLNRYYKKRTGRKISINIAYSNQAFELWYLLHFDFHTTGYHRTQYKKMLSVRLKKEYKKNDLNIYDDLQTLSENTNGRHGQEFAIKNAKKLRKGKSNIHNVNPSTSVDLLVIELNEHLKS
jgi:hypothetical protein